MRILQIPVFAALAIFVSVECTNNDMVYDNGMILQEEFVASTQNDNSSIEKKNQHFLRRELQVGCQASNPSNVYVCGGAGGGADDPCEGSTASCAELAGYACTCGGSTETTCSYCQIRTANSILCQVTGSSVSFVDPSFTLMSCSCEYIGNGQANQECNPTTESPAISPVAFPSIVSTTNSPIAVPTAVMPAVSPSVVLPTIVQTTNMPIALPTIVMPVETPSAVLPTIIATTNAPVAVPTNVMPVESPLQQAIDAAVQPVQPQPEEGEVAGSEVTCQADYGGNIALSSTTATTCNDLPDYPCTCTGSSETSCSYCMIRTEPDTIRCQVSGSSVTFTDHMEKVTTCSCQYIGNGQVVQNCFQEKTLVPLPAPAIVTTPAPVTRVPVAFTVPAPVVPAAESTGTEEEKEKSLKSKKRR